MSETGNGNSLLITAVGLVYIQFRSTGCLKEEGANRFPSMCGYRHTLVAKLSGKTSKFGQMVCGNGILWQLP